MSWTPPTAEQHADATLAQRVRHLREDVQRMTDAPDGPSLIGLAVAFTSTQADLARLSGLTGNTITALKRGKRPTAAQRAAIYWAVAKARGI